MADDLLTDLAARGLLHDSTDAETLRRRLAEGRICLYYGCDPSADSLHIGNLIGLLVLRRFQDAGHRPIALAGGATGLIGDPSGRADERDLPDEASIAANVAGIEAQLRHFLDFDAGPIRAELVDNRAWTEPVGVLEFLRDVGKHMTVNQMLAKESVRRRLESETGLSFTEFSYMLIQANDYRHLAEHFDCELQIGGSDQWGNITAGIDLVRRLLGRAVHGLTWPLLTRSDGQKFGKTADGAVWLARHRTSPYRFFQYWMQVDDRDLERFLLWFTLLPVSEVREIVADHAREPGERRGHRVLARHVTTLVHGEAAVRAAAQASEILFGSDVGPADEAAYELLADEVPSTRLARSMLLGTDLVELLVKCGLAGSKSDVRRTPDGFSINGAKVGDRTTLEADDLRSGRYVLLGKGKRTHHLLVADDG